MFGTRILTIKGFQESNILTDEKSGKKYYLSNLFICKGVRRYKYAQILPSFGDYWKIIREIVISSEDIAESR